MNIVLFLLMNLIVGLSAFLLTYKVFKFADFIGSLLSLFILYFTQIVSTELILGILGMLFIKNLILINFVILFIIWSMTRNKDFSLNFVGLKDALWEFFSNKFILFLVTVILVFASVKIFINLINPPFGWDSLNYHFTFPVEWLKNGNLDNPITISDDPGPSYYPINGSLFYLWLMFPLKNVFLADLGQVPFFILVLLAIYNISRKLGLDRELSFFAAGIFFIIPNFFKQLSIAYVDVIVAGLFLAALNYLFSLTEELSLKNTLFYSLSLGLVLGTKTIALPYSILLFLPFILLCCKNINKGYLLIFSILIITAMGGFSYIRNFIETRNPLYPLDLKLFGQNIFKGVIDGNTYRAHFKIEDYNLTKLLFHEGLGAQTLIFILPSIFLALPITLIKRKKMLNFNFTYFLMLPFLIYLIYRYIIPLANTRYLYPLLGTGTIISFYVLGILNIPKRIISILVVMSTLASISELAKRQELIISAVLTLSLFFFLPSLIKCTQQIKVVKSNLFISSLSIFIIFVSILMYLDKDYIKNEYSRYVKMARYSGFWPDAVNAWEWLNANTTGNNIAYAGRPVPFPLYGSNFKNNVYYVSVNKIEPAKLHYFSHSRYRWGYDFSSLHKNLEERGNYRADADYSIWLNNLAGKNIDYLFIYSLHQTKNIEFPMEDIWARSNSHNFSPIFTNNTIHIYRILK